MISVPKRLRCYLADRPNAVAALTRIFIEEIERLLCTAAGPTRDGRRPSAARPRLVRQTTLPRHLATLESQLMARVGEEFPFACPGCGGDIRLRGDWRQEPAHFEPEVRKRKKATMASPT